ncbi:MAG: hypothetical protein JWM85_1063 [Acidimicrobiaceae bacterium]|nr:hypothetical protein [Acidimicrobiaceae bacterium]
MTIGGNIGYCDEPGCPVSDGLTISLGQPSAPVTVQSVRAHLADKRWTFDGALDYCPEHAPSADASCSVCPFVSIQMVNGVAYCLQHIPV